MGRYWLILIALGGAIAVIPQFFSTQGTREKLAVTGLPRLETVNSKDDSVLVFVPAGPFTMGGPGDNGYGQDEEKARVVNLNSYSIGKFAVTNEQFRRFASETSYKAAGPWEYYAQKWGEAAPVVEVSWIDAVAYCKWANLRLPTAAEWEKAARGPDQRSYPWGDTWDPCRCRCSWRKDGDSGGPAPVDSYPSGISPYGCLQMVGNVHQFCSSTEMSEFQSVRGASWRTQKDYELFFLVTLRNLTAVNYHRDDLGFRVAKSGRL